LNTESTENVLNLIEELPHGAIERITDPVVGEMTMTSANLAIVRTEDDHLRVDMMSRSADESKLFAVRNDITNCVVDRGGTIDQLEPYPAWNPSSEDDFYTMAQQVYQQTFQKSLKMSKTHGGLELGYFKKNGWDMPMISFGPTIHKAHETKESVDIESVSRFYAYLKTIVQKISQ
jgi:dipeptidase D